MGILLFTSGTTSKSKAVMLSQKNIASNIYAMQTCEDIRDTDTNIAFLPFHHIFGSTCMVMMIASGVKTVFPDELRYIKNNLNEYKVTIFVGVPILVEAIYKTIMKEIEKQGKTKLIKAVIKFSNALLKIHIDLRRKLFKQVINALGGELRFVYDKEIVKEKYPEKTEEEVYQIIWQQVKEINKGFPRYKHIQNMILTDKELIKTSTKKVKRQEEMKLICQN